MSVAEIVLLGVALSADAFAVTISDCCAYPHETRWRFAIMPIFFGGFQALMPTLGYFVGGLAAEFIEHYSGIITFVILGAIGANMIREGASQSKAHLADDLPSQSTDEERHLSISMLLFQSVATAIDAFAVGVSLRAVSVNLPQAVSIIGITTVICCVVALFLGRRLGQALGQRAEIFGGTVLVLIGIRALVALF
ncbi:MAG: manganese efflux pump [Atopobium sp.]|jgi:putative Mn2+ efflux pump MntP|nr:manganese efflux pump [Atopobium sp.]